VEEYVSENKYVLSLIIEDIILQIIKPGYTYKKKSINSLFQSLAHTNDIKIINIKVPIISQIGPNMVLKNLILIFVWAI
jgi:hypothetical protein